MKKVITALSLLLLLGGMIIINSSCGCRAPNCVREWVCDEFGKNCHWRTRRRFLVENNFQNYTSNLNEYVGIWDLADPWQPDTNGILEAKVKFENSVGQTVEQSFQLTYSSSISQTISEVDKDTTPYAFVFNDPSAVSNFLNSSFASGHSNSDAEVTFSISVVQVDCTIPSGKYVNHLRVKDSSGITYDSSFKIVYTANGQGCNQGTITIED